MSTIEDPRNDNALAIDDTGHAKIDAITTVDEGAAATKGNSFIIHGECHTALASSGGFISIKNISPTYNIAITRIYIDAGSLTNHIIITQLKEPVTSGGTDVSSTAIVNKNFGSVNTLDAVVLISDASADLILTGGEKFHTFSCSSLESKQRNMKGTNIITQNKNWALGWKTESGNAVDGEVISFSINCYLRNKNGDIL